MALGSRSISLLKPYLELPHLLSGPFLLPLVLLHIYILNFKLG